jgi:hypothetical protein
LKVTVARHYGYFGQTKIAMGLLMKLLASNKLTMACGKLQIHRHCLDPSGIKLYQELALPSRLKVAVHY